MFATLLGALPRPPLPVDAEPLHVLRARIEAQLAAGLEPVTDGEGPRLVDAAEAWLAASRYAGSVAAKQAIAGPWTRYLAHGGPSLQARIEETAGEARALAEAGCPLVEVHEPAVANRSFDESERAAIVDGWRRVVEAAALGPATVHVALAVTGGDATGLGASVYEAPFASYAFDLRDGPDNWRVIAAAPRERGIVVGALSAAEHSDDGPELLAWAVHYAASLAGRGLDRVGLATAGSLEQLPWDVAHRKLQCLGRAAEIAARPSFRDMAPDFDPRAAGMKSAALGRFVPPCRRRARPKER